VSRLVLTLLLCSAGAAAQAPLVGDINFYGLRKIAPERILAAAKLRSGAPLPASKGDLEDDMEKVSGVVLAHVEAVCCDGAAATLFIGIVERGSPLPAFHSPPGPTTDPNATLPPELVDTYRGFLTKVAGATARGNTTEDLTAGHSIMDDPEARALQPRFLAFAAEHLDWLRNALRHAPDPEQRAIAAAVIGYAPDKKSVIDDLQYAIQDSDTAVRANAMRALAAIAVYASKHPGQGIRVSATWLVEMLNSIVLGDRLEAARALVILTDAPNPAVLNLVRERGLTALAEMARWKTLRYALPPFLLVGRVAGLPDAQVQQAWERGDRESVISKALQ